MKKVGITITLTAIVGLILAGCAGNSEPAPAPAPEPEPEPVSGIVAGIPWADREFLDYVIQDYEGNDIGMLGLTIAREMGDTYILKQLYAFKQQVAQLLTTTKVRADNLKPIIGRIVFANVSPAPVITYEYEDGIVSISTLVEDDILQDTMDVPEDAYDDNELLFLLRTIPFEIGYTVSFTDMIVASAQKHVITITVVGEEEIQVPAGSFDAYQVELTIAGDKKYLWYGKDKPHYLLKLDDGRSVTLLEEIGEDTGFSII